MSGKTCYWKWIGLEKNYKVQPDYFCLSIIVNWKNTFCYETPCIMYIKPLRAFEDFIFPLGHMRTQLVYIFKSISGEKVQFYRVVNSKVVFYWMLFLISLNPSQERKFNSTQSFTNTNLMRKMFFLALPRSYVQLM